MKKKEVKSIFCILVVFCVLFTIWQLWIPASLDDWKWGGTWESNG